MVGSSSDSVSGWKGAQSPAHRCWKTRGDNEEGTVRTKQRRPGPSHQDPAQNGTPDSHGLHCFQHKLGGALSLVFPTRPWLTPASDPGPGFLLPQKLTALQPFSALKVSRPRELSVHGTQGGSRGFRCRCL